MFKSSGSLPMQEVEDESVAPGTTADGYDFQITDNQSAFNF